VYRKEQQKGQRELSAYARHSLAVDIQIVDRYGAAGTESIQQVTRGVKSLHR
jgi:hypothetical protein